MSQITPVQSSREEHPRNPLIDEVTQSLGRVVIGGLVTLGLSGLFIGGASWVLAQMTDAVAARGDDHGVLVGPGFVDSFEINCLRTAATKIEAGCGQVSYEAQVPSDATASVVFGDSAITASGGGITRAAGASNGGNVRYEYCRTTLDAGVSIEVRALCSSAP